MFASFAEYEREAICERILAGLHRACRSGRHFGVAPYGYRVDEQGRLQVVPEEANIVRGVIKRIVEGFSLYAETKRLNDLGIPTQGGATVAVRKVQALGTGLSRTSFLSPPTWASMSTRMVDRTS